MTYLPMSQGDKNYIARRMADGLTYDQACDMLDEHYALMEDEHD